MNALPLQGLGILTTRPEAQAERTAAALRAAGAEVFLFPALAIEPIESAALDQALAHMERASLAIFVSANAVEFGVAALLKRGLGLSGVSIAAIGNATRDALGELGLQADITPSSGSDSEALLAHPALQAVAGQPIILFRGVGESGGRQLISQTLTARGGEVIIAECYRRSRPAATAQQVEAVVAALRDGRLQAAHVMSVETLDNLTGLLGGTGTALLRGILLVVPHERIAAAARERGFRQVSVSGLADDQLIEALCITRT